MRVSGFEIDPCPQLRVGNRDAHDRSGHDIAGSWGQAGPPAQIIGGLRREGRKWRFRDGRTERRTSERLEDDAAAQ